MGYGYKLQCWKINYLNTSYSKLRTGTVGNDDEAGVTLSSLMHLWKIRTKVLMLVEGSSQDHTEAGVT